MESDKMSRVYDAHYFTHYSSTSGRPYQRDDPWLSFFDLIAERIVSDIQAKTVLDAGCAMGFLVECLRRRGIDAYGVDISEYAIGNVHQDVRQYCWVGSVLDPLPQRYELIVSIEVLEHLPKLESELALSNLCRYTDDVLFSSSPCDYKEATHLNVQPPEYWAELFARQGFLRDLEFDGSIITPWAARFRRISTPAWRIVSDYERRLWRLSERNNAQQELVIEQRNELSQKEQHEIDLNAQLIKQKDEFERLISDQEPLREKVAELESTLEQIYASEGWNALSSYYSFRERILPHGTRRRELAKSVWTGLSLKSKTSKGSSGTQPIATQKKTARLGSEAVGEHIGSQASHQEHALRSASFSWREPRLSGRNDSNFGARVLVISGDTLPLNGMPTSGAGLRAWGLGEGLRSRGHNVSYAMPKDAARKRRTGGSEVYLFDPLTLDDVVAKLDPDVLVFQHWPWLSVMRERPRGFVVVDFHGPLLLETHFRDSNEVKRILPSKLESIARADFFTCAGKKQLYYYLGWLLLAGLDLRTFPISVIPFSLSPALPDRTWQPKDPTFVYGGMFLPWQDPAIGLKMLVSEMERAEQGELRFFGGKHPWLALPYERFDSLRTELERSKRVRFSPPLARDDLIREYTSASVAWDLMARNPERELAFTSRTVEYLWCGLPVVYNNYAELSRYIEQYEAGWIVDPEDGPQIQDTIRQIFANPGDVQRRGRNALKLVRENLTWDRTIEPLDQFCRHPYRTKRTFAGSSLLEGGDAFIHNPLMISPEVLNMLNRIKRLLPPASRQVIKRLLRSRQSKQN